MIVIFFAVHADFMPPELGGGMASIGAVMRDFRAWPALV
jgi:hypothetical protein